MTNSKFRSLFILKAGPEEITTIVVNPGSVVTLRYTVNEDCDLRWKFIVDKGDIGFGIQKTEAIQKMMFREEVENYRLEMFSSDESQVDEPSVGNVASVTSDTYMMVGPGLPEIQINDEGDNEEKESRRAFRKNSLLVCVLILNLTSSQGHILGKNS